MHARTHMYYIELKAIWNGEHRPIYSSACAMHAGSAHNRRIYMHGHIQ
jgi:outer membrane protein OmpA-like peptidoglycan-associated protein